MKSRFKFRVWKGKEKKMVYEVTHLNPLILDKNINPENRHNKVMQCIGLRDVNGKLMYEGDVIVVPNQYPFFDYKNKTEQKKSLNDTNGEIEGESIINYVGVIKWIYSQWQFVYHCVNPEKSGISDGINNAINDFGYEDDKNT